MRAPTKHAVTIGRSRYVLTAGDHYLDGVGQEFEPETCRLFRAVADGAGTVIDAGAHVGCTALLFAQVARQVHALEPANGPFQDLQDNLRRNRVENVEAHPFGLGVAAGSATLAFAAGERSGGYVCAGAGPAPGLESERIDLRRLDDLREATGPIDVLKLDLEGFEQEALTGATTTLKQDHPVVLLELNHWCLNAFRRRSVPDFLDFLRVSFPILLAIDGREARDLHDRSDDYHVLYHHILGLRFRNLVGGFDPSLVDRLRSAGFSAG